MENKIKKYLSKCDKDALIGLYLQMRFERDLYADMYESMMVNVKSKDKGWDLNDSKVAYGYNLGYADAKKDLGEVE